MMSGYIIPKNVGAPGRGGGRGRGGGGGGSQFSHTPLPDFMGRHARYCVWCKKIVPEQAHEKPASCPHCQRMMPLRGSGWHETSGWGRCSSCDSFMHKAHHYCQCGKENSEALRRVAENSERNLKRELSIKEMELDKMRRKLRKLEEEKVELSQKVDDDTFSQMGNGNGQITDESGNISRPLTPHANLDVDGNVIDP